MLEPGQPRAHVRHLAPVQGRRGQQHPGVPQTQALLDRLRAERGEQRAEHRSVLERAERRDVQLRDPAREHEHPLAALHPERREHAREAVRLPLQLPVGELRRRVALAQEAQRDRVRQGTVRVAIDRLVGDVQAAVGQAGEAGPRRRPRELRPRPIVVGQVRSVPARVRLANRMPARPFRKLGSHHQSVA